MKNEFPTGFGFSFIPENGAVVALVLSAENYCRFGCLSAFLGLFGFFWFVRSFDDLISFTRKAALLSWRAIRWRLLLPLFAQPAFVLQASGCGSLQDRRP